MMYQAQNDQTLRMKRRAFVGFLACGAVASGIVGYQVWLRPSYEGAQLSVADAYQQAKDEAILLVDIRQPEEWKITGIPEAAIPIDMRRSDFSDALLTALGSDTSRPIALICARGVRSARLSTRLTEAGFTNIVDVPEGMLGSGAGPGWLARDLPTQPYDGAAG